MKRLACLIVALLAVAAGGAVENFTTWTEVDPLSVLTVSSPSVVAAGVQRKTASYVYKDWGADYWNDDWTIRFEFTPGAISHADGTFLGVLSLANTVGSWSPQYSSVDGGAAAVHYGRTSSGYSMAINWGIRHNPNQPDEWLSSEGVTVAPGTKYYCTFLRDRDGGAYEQGRFTLRVCTTNYYGESGAATVGSATLDVPADRRRDYRYTHVTYNRTSGGDQTVNGTIESLNLDAGEPAPETPPAKAGTPNPTHQATSVARNKTLSWAAVPYAANYDVYFSKVSDGSIGDHFVGNVSTPSYSPALMDYETVYQWRVDANNVYGATTGDTWTFTTLDEPVEPEPGDYYYVDPIIGNDTTGSGTLAAPWKTMNKAGSSSTTNDAIYVLAWNTTLESEVWPTNRLYFANGVYSNGVTWTFDTTYQIGRFCTGDFWVLGPVKVEGISPASTVVSGSTRNGSMVNPITNGGQGFDSRSGRWNSGLNVGSGISGANPLVVGNSSSLLSAISLDSPSDISWINKIAILTVLASAPDDGSFRPSYFGTDKTVRHKVADINYGALGSLNKSAAGISVTVPNLETVTGYFQRPWVSFMPDADGRSIHPIGNGMPPYGEYYSVRLGTGALMANLNYTDNDKRSLVIGLAQIGIDWHGVGTHPGGRTTWLEAGGLAMGHKFPILFAGKVLGSAELLSIGQKSGAYLWSAKPGGGNYGPGNIPPDYIYFQEDMQTFYVSAFEVGLILDTSISGYALGATSNTITVRGFPRWWGQHVGQRIEITSGPGAGQIRTISATTYVRTQQVADPTTITVSQAWSTTPTTASQYRVLGYEASHLGLPEWGQRHASYPTQSNPAWHADYRWINGVSWPGWTLAAWIMDLKDDWNHDALFDYVDRWMELSSPGGDYARDEGPTSSSFHTAMWNTFRDNYPLENQPPAKPRIPVPANGAALVHPFTNSLSWTATMDANVPTYAASFEVFFGLAAGSLTTIDTVTTTSIDLPSDLTYGVTYYWRVDANNPEGVTTGDVWSFTTEPGIPLAVATGSPANGATGVAVIRNLTWSSSAGATSYTVYLNGALLATTATTGVPVTLDYNTQYTWRVDAVGPGGTTTGTTWGFRTVAAPTQDPDPPALPEMPELGRRYIVPTPLAMRVDMATSRYSTPLEGLRADEMPLENGLFAIEGVSGYLEGVVVQPEGTDPSWTLTIADAWGSVLFHESFNNTDGTVGWYGQRLPFVEGLQITVDGLDDTAWLRLLLTETWRR